MHSFYVTALVFGIVFSACFADDDDEDDKKLSMDDVKNKFEDAFSDPMDKMGDFFKNSADEVKARAQDSIQTMKEFGEQAQEKSKAGLDVAKGLAEGMGQRLSKVKESVEESGEKMKDAFTGAVTKSKDEFDTAASKITEHAKKASDTIFGLFTF